MDRKPLKERARGRWQAMLLSLGVDRLYLTGKHTACPICREGKDRFRFDDKDGAGTWICSHCGAGDGIKLVMLVNGWEFKQAAIEIEKHVGSAAFRAPKKERSIADKRADMNALWKRSEPIQVGDPAARYLAARCGITVFPPCLRSVTSLRYFDEGCTSWHPGMIAMVVDGDGRPANLHRTYLTTIGTRAAVDEPRRTMSGVIPKGSAIRLAPHAGVLGIAEGIETAFSATALFGVPCWAVINKAIMSKWIVAPDVQELIIFADNDRNYSGQAAAFELAHRITKAGLSVSVKFPPIADTDWNDVHQQRSIAA